MPRSQHRKLRPHRDCLAIVGDLVAGTAAAQEIARATLRREVGDYVECDAKLPIGSLHDSELGRRIIAQRVLLRLEADACSLLKEWRTRVLRRRDHASFWTMVKTVVWYVSVEYAQGAGAAAGSLPVVESLR